MQIEFQILDALQKIHTPVLDGVMCLITSLGNAGIIWILLTIALLINPKIRRTKDGTACRLFGESGRRSGCILLAALILDLILCNGILKNLFHRVRPYLNAVAKRIVNVRFLFTLFLSLKRKESSISIELSYAVDGT